MPSVELKNERSVPMAKFTFLTVIPNKSGRLLVTVIEAEGGGGGGGGGGNLPVVIIH